MVKVKICGVTRLPDALLASDLGASAIGFVFWEGSPRAVTPADAAKIAARIPPDVAPVGVFVDAAPAWVREVAAQVGLAAVQLYGSGTADDDLGLPVRVIRAAPVRTAADVDRALRLPERVTALVDAYDPVRRGGSGRTADWALAAAVAARRRIFLAGGLRPGNVAAAIGAVGPYGIDVSSGVEAAPGVKDPGRLRAFFAAAAGAVRAAPTDVRSETQRRAEGTDAARR